MRYTGSTTKRIRCCNSLCFSTVGLLGFGENECTRSDACLMHCTCKECTTFPTGHGPRGWNHGMSVSRCPFRAELEIGGVGY